MWCKKLGIYGEGFRFIWSLGCARVEKAELVKRSGAGLLRSSQWLSKAQALAFL